MGRDFGVPCRSDSETEKGWLGRGDLDYSAGLRSFWPTTGEPQYKGGYKGVLHQTGVARLLQLCHAFSLAGASQEVWPWWMLLQIWRDGSWKMFLPATPCRTPLWFQGWHLDWINRPVKCRCDKQFLFGSHGFRGVTKAKILEDWHRCLHPMFQGPRFFPTEFWA